MFAEYSVGRKQYWGGSCQYETMGDVVHSRKSFASFDEWKERFGLRADFSEALPMEEIKARAIELLEEDAAESVQFAKENPAWADSEGQAEEAAQLLEFRAREFQDAREVVRWLFKLAQGRAWDLWGTVPWICELCFMEVKIEAVPEVLGTKDLPLLNMMAQDGNHGLGIALVGMMEAELLTLEDMDDFSFDT